MYIHHQHISRCSKSPRHVLQATTQVRGWPTHIAGHQNGTALVHNVPHQYVPIGGQSPQHGMCAAANVWRWRADVLGHEGCATHVQCMSSGQLSGICHASVDDLRAVGPVHVGHYVSDACTIFDDESPMLARQRLLRHGIYEDTSHTRSEWLWHVRCSHSLH